MKPVSISLNALAYALAIYFGCRELSFVNARVIETQYRIHVEERDAVLALMRQGLISPPPPHEDTDEQ